MIRSLLIVVLFFSAFSSFAQLKADSSIQLKSKSNYTSTKYTLDSTIQVITGGIPEYFGDVDGGVVSHSTELENAKSQLLRVLIRQSELTENEQIYQASISDGNWQKIEKARIHWLNEIERLSPTPQPTQE